jgi:CYTH domain-containing protein
MEIERKYAIHTLPKNLSQYTYKKIEQGYLCNNPTLRIRKSNDDYILTYKSKKGLPDSKEGGAVIHNEVELPLTKEAYLTLLSKIEHNLVVKTRYLIPLYNGFTAELDIFEGFLSGLAIVEVEFPDEKASYDFVPPSWFGMDLSSDKRFSNYHLSTLTNCDDLGIEMLGI